jgi:hypothetical protein
VKVDIFFACCYAKPYSLLEHRATPCSSVASSSILRSCSCRTRSERSNVMERGVLWIYRSKRPKFYQVSTSYRFCRRDHPTGTVAASSPVSSSAGRLKIVGGEPDKQTIGSRRSSVAIYRHLLLFLFIHQIRMSHRSLDHHCHLGPVNAYANPQQTLVRLLVPTQSIPVPVCTLHTPPTCHSSLPKDRLPRNSTSISILPQVVRMRALPSEW